MAGLKSSETFTNTKQINMNTDPKTSINSTVDGLTKREYFSARAMQGYAASDFYSGDDPDDIAKSAVILADALINALNEH